MTFPTEDPSKPCLEPGAQLRPGPRQQAQCQLQPRRDHPRPATVSEGPGEDPILIYFEWH